MNVKESIKRYWDARSKDYDRSPGHTDLPELWKRVLSNTFNEKMRILDIGTGTGFLALLLAELGHEVVGIDLSEGMLRVAREKARKLGIKIEFELGDAENLPFDDESFDATICRHVLWTLPNPQKAIIEWCRVIKPGGKIVIIDGAWFDRSIAASLKRFIGRVGVAIYERRNPLRNCPYRKMLPFYGTLTPEKVAEMLRNADFVDISVHDLSWIREAMLKRRPFFYRLAWSSKAYFMVEGFKGV